MKLRDVEYGPVHYASGTGGFEDPKREYWYHAYPTVRLICPDLTGATPTRKTVTLHRRDTTSGANMDLDPQSLAPTEWIPRSIMINPFLCCSVNAVGLANEGLEAHLDRGVWQAYPHPQFISLMAIGATHAERMDEWDAMFRLLQTHLHEFRAPFTIQENQSCPNAGRDPRTLIDDTIRVLARGAKMLPGVSQVPKFNVWQLGIESALEIGTHPACDALLFSNTLPWYDVPLWLRMLSFGTPFSPLRWRGVKTPGGYAGPYLLSHVAQRTRDLRALGFSKPIIACGGITRVRHVDRLHAAGADAIEFATVAMPGGRPWRVQPIIQRAHTLWRC